MSQFLRSVGGMLGCLLPGTRNDDRCQHASYADRGSTCKDYLWPRSSFLGQAAGAGSFLGELDNSLEVWDWDTWLSSAPGSGQKRDAVTGITRDSAGVALGSVQVIGFDSTRDEKTDKTTSDANGNYIVTTPYTGQTMYCVAYKAGTPVYGATGILTPS